MAVAKHAALQDWNSKSPCATERLAKNILPQSPRLDGVNLPANSEQRRLSDSCAIVSPREMQGSQLIGLGLSSDIEGNGTQYA